MVFAEGGREISFFDSGEGHGYLSSSSSVQKGKGRRNGVSPKLLCCRAKRKRAVFLPKGGSGGEPARVQHGTGKMLVINRRGEKGEVGRLSVLWEKSSRKAEKK